MTTRDRQIMAEVGQAQAKKNKALRAIETEEGMANNPNLWAQVHMANSQLHTLGIALQR